MGKSNLYSAKVFLSGAKTVSFEIQKTPAKEFLRTLKDKLHVPQTSFIHQIGGTYKGGKGRYTFGTELVRSTMKYRKSNTIFLDCITEYTETPFRHFSIEVTMEEP